MQSHLRERVRFREVGPRDGLQAARTVMVTSAKRAWIDAMVAAGVTEIEVASFVPPARIPQMADAPLLVAAIRAAHPQLHITALAPNLHGARNAVAAGADSILVPVSASQAHSHANVRRSREEQVAEFSRIVAWARTPPPATVRIEAGISTAFGCSLQGVVAEADVLALATSLAAAGADRVALADTLGYAYPRQIRRLVRGVRAEIGAVLGNLHLHDTLGTALANVLAGLEEGVRGFDGALGGLGGCPFAPGSVGNVASEDLIYLLEQEGFDTGVDLERLLAARAILAQGLPDEKLHGRIAAAGIPPTYRANPLNQIDNTASKTPPSGLPLAGIRVLEFSHMVMGPSCGMFLADLGADVIKIEPAPTGDNTRRLTGLATGLFPSFNRNKRSLCVDLKTAAGRSLVQKMARNADIVIENFRLGAMDKLGLGFATLSHESPRLIYCSMKGFLPGPYEHRAALDEVVQMMGGLAYMTGRPGQPMRAGASVNDIMGGLFAALAIMAALRARETTGRGGLVQSGLFETNMVLMAQHMATAAVMGENPVPFGDPSTLKPWPLYDIFETNTLGEELFVGVVTETQWHGFCAAFGLDDLIADPDLASMTQLAQARPRIRARVNEVFATLSKAELITRCEKLGLPFAAIAKPLDLFADPHLRASGGLLSIDMVREAGLAVGVDAVGLPGLPIILDDEKLGLRLQPPRVGEHGAEILREAGFSADEIASFLQQGVISIT